MTSILQEYEQISVPTLNSRNRNQHQILGTNMKALNHIYGTSCYKTFPLPAFKFGRYYFVWGPVSSIHDFQCE